MIYIKTKTKMNANAKNEDTILDAILRALRLECQRSVVNAQYIYAKTVAKTMNRGEIVYPNQKEAANACIRHFNDGKFLVILVAHPGTGKTGTILDFMIGITTHPDDERCVEIKDIHLMSGMSDNQWRDQTQSKMLPEFRDRIYHRGELKKRQTELSDLKNAVVINDEVHVASGKAMTISKSLIAAGLNDANVLESKQIRMLDISATPEAISKDSKAWGDKSAIVFLQPGKSYKGFEVMLAENRIRQAPSFTTYAVVQQWFQTFVSRYESTSKKFFPLRVQKSETLGFIRRAIVEFDWDEIKHDAEDRVANIDEIMETPPDKHTIILIKHFWRASKRIVRVNIGGSYETVPKKENNTSAAQGLCGRFCDNYEYEGHELNPDLRPLHFGDKASIEAYVNWFNHGCDYGKADYHSSRIGSSKGCVKSKDSTRHESVMRNLDAVVVQNIDLTNIHKRIPVMFDEFPINKFTQAVDKKGFIKKFIENKFDTIEDEEFIEIISNTDCFQQSTPGVDGSRKRNIDLTRDSVLNRRKLGIKDATGRYKTISCWQAFIDNQENRVYILWQKM
jgi:hypothetical protein